MMGDEKTMRNHGARCYSVGNSLKDACSDRIHAVDARKDPMNRVTTNRFRRAVGRNKLPFGLLFVLLYLCSADLDAAENLLQNPGFESALAPAWEKRTPEDAKRTLRRTEKEGRSGNGAAVLENIKPAYTRLRQGHDRSIGVRSGSLLQLSAWVKSELSDDGRITVQLYCMSKDDKILAQPTSRPIRGGCDWTQARAFVIVPERTAYVMAYLQMRDGTGRVLFDDVELAVKREPRPHTPAPKVALLTDLPEDSLCHESLKVLFADGLFCLDPQAVGKQLTGCTGVLVLFQSGSVPASALKAIEKYATQGGRVFMDVRNFAQWQRTKAVPVQVLPADARTVEARMAAGLRVVKASDVTAGFEVGQVIPRAGHPSGELFVLPKGFQTANLEVLAVGPGGQPGVVRLPVGRGFVVAADVLSLREPFYSNVDAYYKYTLITNALTNPVRFGRYYPRKLSYAELVEFAEKMAAKQPALRFQDEGPASEGRRIFSLNLGRPGAPLYLLYAAAHGSEWEPGYGLLTFAEHVAQGRMKDVIDLDKVAIKIVPFLNPWGYDNRRRQNAQGVDLNRQGDYLWEQFQGRDSNEDGTWSPGDYDWKGARPFCEPEAQTYKAILDRAKNLHCVLDYHGNPTATSNKVGILPATAHPDNELRALELQYVANERLRGRHLLRQNREETYSQYLLDRVVMGGNRPYLINTSARGRYGILIELTAAYASSYGTVLQTDVACELCRALFVAYPPP